MMEAQTPGQEGVVVIHERGVNHMISNLLA